MTEYCSKSTLGESPLVSFVIPIFNSETDIACCLGSIQRQHGAAETDEVGTLDNGYIAQTHRIMTDLGFAFHVVPKVTVSTLRNRGAAFARGQSLAFVDADVELSQAWLQNGLAVFVDAMIVASGCCSEGPSNATWEQRTWELPQGDDSRTTPSELAPGCRP